VYESHAQINSILYLLKINISGLMRRKTTISLFSLAYTLLKRRISVICDEKWAMNLSCYNHFHPSVLCYGTCAIIIIVTKIHCKFI